MSNGASSSRSFFANSSSFNDYNTELQTTALHATKASAALPADIAFHRSLDSNFAKLIDSTAEKALHITNKLIALVGNDAAKVGQQGKGKLKLQDEDDVVDRFKSVVIDVIDQLFERTDICLDEILGQRNSVVIPVPPTPQPSASAKKARLDPSLSHAAHLLKPQLKFKQKIDNFNDTRRTSVLRHKYNAKVPLGYDLQVAEGDSMEVSEKPASRRHPYSYEIQNISYPHRMFEHCAAVAPLSFDETPLTWVNTEESLQEMLDKLRNSREIAVDLEYHNYRSFAGFVCLMQISTRSEDFVVDTLELREELEELNEVFTDPNVVKVFHGANSDILWLQQNFNVFVVNLFDTYHASKELDFPRHGLAALLEMYCDFVPDKRYQLADWRMRPLPDVMLKYARSDTHFLLFIYDNLRNALLDRGGGSSELIRNVLANSQETALHVYEKEVYDFETGSGTGGWDTLLQKWNKVLLGTELDVFRGVHRWRDNLGREEDESTRYILPNHYLFQLAEKQPADMTALMAILKPIPPMIRTRAGSLLDAIKAAVKEGSIALDDINQPSANTTADTIHTSTPSPSAIGEQTEDMSYDGIATSSSATPQLLWTKIVPEISAPSSALLRNSFAADKDLGVHEPFHSTLFPSGWTTAKPSSDTFKLSTRYQVVLSKIHGALVVAPTVAKIRITNSSGVTETQLTREEGSKPDDECMEVSEQIEIPFIPQSQRQPAAVEGVDTIVVVGQPRQKKRKRTKPTGDGDANKKTRAVPESDETIEPFDYNSAPNLLDGPSARTEGKDGRQSKDTNKRGGAKNFYGNFPAPPRAYNEVKAGNQTSTFR